MRRRLARSPARLVVLMVVFIGSLCIGLSTEGANARFSMIDEQVVVLFGILMETSDKRTWQH